MSGTFLNGCTFTKYDSVSGINIIQFHAEISDCYFTGQAGILAHVDSIIYISNRSFKQCVCVDI